MMNKQIAALVLAVSVVGGIGAGVLANALTSEAPATADRQADAPTTPPTEGGEAGMPAPDLLVIAPGAVGPVEVGMSQAEALETGYFVADVPAPVNGCVDLPLAWKEEYVYTYDVKTLGNGEISSIGVYGEGVVTEDGVGVGSTLAEVKATIPDGTPVEAGYNQSGMYDYDAETGRYIGYLFDAQLNRLKDSDEVSFVEVTKGGQPSLMRDGC